ncbi:TPM domain-containing protein [Parahaliea aestuarii]|uniref:YgcG family protein n=1 Tax=Parahaliea aestuarii TaxID=1852021 RepID=A0A5C8ZQZ5_9GAMM|nr:YgcG family protein [Parahaliea aestuarii]TXS90926.1 YgcG family protein [Parahaliea aestuarii]
MAELRFAPCLRWAIALALFLGACGLAAQPLQAVPKLEQRVSDFTGTLNAEQRQTLEARLAQLEKDTGSQLAILVVDSTAPEDIAAYSIRVVDQWQLGREKFDDGALLLIARQDRRMRIEVGYGLEGAITDAQARQIIDEMIAPHFRNNDYFGGIKAGSQALETLIRGEELPPPAKSRGRSSQGIDWGTLLPVIFVVGWILTGTLHSLLGRTGGSIGLAAMTGGLTWAIAGAIGLAFIIAIVTLAVAMLVPGGNTWSDRGGFGGGYGGGFGGGGFGGGGGGFGGGGGGFGGGGASGGW